MTGCNTGYQSIITPYESDGLAEKLLVGQVEPDGSLDLDDLATPLSSDAEIDLSDPEGSAFDYDPEDPFLYAIEKGMGLESLSIESRDEYEKPTSIEARVKEKHPVKKFHKGFIYNEWQKDQENLAEAELDGLEFFLPQNIVTGTPIISANFAYPLEYSDDDILF